AGRPPRGPAAPRGGSRAHAGGRHGRRLGRAPIGGARGWTADGGPGPRGRDHGRRHRPGLGLRGPGGAVVAARGRRGLRARRSAGGALRAVDHHDALLGHRERTRRLLVDQAAVARAGGGGGARRRPHGAGLGGVVRRGAAGPGGGGRGPGPAPAARRARGGVDRVRSPVRAGGGGARRPGAAADRPLVGRREPLRRAPRDPDGRARGGGGAGPGAARVVAAPVRPGRGGDGGGARAARRVRPGGGG